MSGAAAEHELTTVIARKARELAYIPEAVAVHEARREAHFLQVHIYAGTNENAAAIIGRGGSNIEEIRRYAESLALDLNLTVKIRVITPERLPAASRP